MIGNFAIVVKMVLHDFVMVNVKCVENRPAYILTLRALFI